jgi:hypothetical protein
MTTFKWISLLGKVHTLSHKVLSVIIFGAFLTFNKGKIVFRLTLFPNLSSPAFYHTTNLPLLMAPLHTYFYLWLAFKNPTKTLANNFNKPA